VDGAGISLFFADDRRLPLGASDEVAAIAERLQYTVGEGPCLSSHAEGQPVIADEYTIRSRWPGFYDVLAARTPIRATISLPLRGELRDIGALDFYVVPPRDVGDLSLRDALVVAEEIASALQAQGRGPRPPDGPVWLDAPAAGRRSLVWQAMGFVNAALEVTSPDALSVLRAHAYAGGLTLDDLAARLVSREVPVEELALGADEPR
jgi:hypothetical protein